MLKKIIGIFIILLINQSCKAVEINDLIKPANPLEPEVNIENTSSVQKAQLTKNDTYNQFAIALNKFIQSNVKSAYKDFSILIESTAPSEYMFMQMSEKMADLGFFDLSSTAIEKLEDDNISYMLKEDIKQFYFPQNTLKKEDELYLAELYSNIIYNEQSVEATDELIKNTELLDKSDYANYVAALGYFKSNNISSAQQFIEIATKKNPTNINYKKLKAEILSQSSKPKNALKVLNEINSKKFLTTQFTNKINSINEYILYKTEKNEFIKKIHLANYYYFENELNKSMRTLQTAFNTKKNNNKIVYAQLSRVYYDLKEYEKAQDNATKAYKSDKNNPVSLLVLGDTALRNNEPKEALKYYEQAAKKDKKSYLPELKLARAYDKIGKTKKSNELYSKILKTHADSYETYYDVALKDKERELNYLKKSVAINYKFKDGWLELSRYAIEHDTFEKAFEFLSNVKCIDENDFKYYYYLGLLYKNKGMMADAKRNFLKSVKLNPKFIPAREELDI